MYNLALQERDNTIPHTIPQPQVTSKSKVIWRNTLCKFTYDFLFCLIEYSPKGNSIQAHHHDGGWQDLQEYNY